LKNSSTCQRLLSSAAMVKGGKHSDRTASLVDQRWNDEPALLEQQERRWCLQQR
jgi:hypothetical protein